MLSNWLNKGTNSVDATLLENCLDYFVTKIVLTYCEKRNYSHNAFEWKREKRRKGESPEKEMLGS